MKKLFKFIILALIPLGMASCNNGGGQAPKVASISLNVSESLTLDPEETFVVNPTAYDKDGNVLNDKTFQFRSSNNLVASITSEGLITAIKKGYSTVTVISETQINHFRVNVGGEEQEDLYYIGFDPSEITIRVGSTYEPNIITMPSDITGINYLWGSSDDSVAVVEDGKIIGKKVGTTQIKATYKNVEGEITVHVSDTGGEFTISLDKSSASLVVGKTLQLNAITSEAATVTWTSSNDGIATVDAHGLVTANTKGSVTITATANGKSASCGVVVSDGTKPSKFNLKVYCYIDYNNVDTENPYYEFDWYTEVPFKNDVTIPNPTTIPDPAFPTFKGWSAHPIIDDLADLWNFNEDVVNNGNYTLVLYGIWFD